MAKGNDDLDLIGLFGLSTEEVAGLGLDSSVAPARPEVRELATPVSEVQSPRSPAWVRDAEPRPIFRAGGGANGRTAGATDSAPASPDTGGRETAPPQRAPALPTRPAGSAPAVGARADRDDSGPRDLLDDDRAFLAMLEGADDGNYRFVLADTAAEEQTARIRTDEVLPAPVIDDADGLDLAALFGLSTEEASGLGLTLPPNAPEMGGASAGDHDEPDLPASLANAMPTMPLRAIATREPGPDSDAPGEPWHIPLPLPGAIADGHSGAAAGTGAVLTYQSPMAAAAATPADEKWARAGGSERLFSHQGAALDDMDSAPGRAESGQRAASARAERGQAPTDTTESPVVPALPLQDLQDPPSAMVLQSQATAGHDRGPISRERAAHDANEDGEDIDPLLLEAFAEESAELLDGLHVELENLERDRGDHGALLEIRRVVHTIKGGAKMCRFEYVVTLTHACENLLDLVADDARPVGEQELRALFACEPLLRSLAHAALSGHHDSAAVDAAVELATHVDALCAGIDGGARGENNEAGIVAAATTVSGDIAPLAPAVPDHGGAKDGISWPVAGDVALADNRPDSVRDTATAVEHEERPRPQAPPVPTTAAMRATPEGAATPERGRRGRESINVDLSKVDAVVAKVTEMAAHRSSYQGMVGQLMETTGEARGNILRLRQLALSIGNECATARPETAVSPARREEAGDLDLESYNALATLALQLQEAVADQQALIEKMYDTITNHWSLRATESRVDADLQSALMNIRLIPLASMRVRLDGVVRQAAQATGKSVRWQLQGGTVAVEKNVFDRLFEPLMHLLRNAVDHGLEAPEARRAAGKPETGVITVTAKQQDNHVIITVADDGAGIVPAKIAAIAVERGVIAAEVSSALSARQQLELIFTPGFSTAASVSHLSGRGVGMDAVREACLRIGGSIAVDSREGLGTTFTMRLPLSLSVTRGLIVRDGGSYMAVPVGQISALHLVPAADIVDAPGAPGAPGGRVARIDGHDLPIYNLPQPSGSAPVAYVQHGEAHVLQVPHEGGSIGLIIEDVLDEEEMLIKAAPPLLRGVKTLLGSYVLPDGAVAPVVNLPQLLADLRPTVTLHEEREDQAARGPVALIVDDSMSMRVALSGTLQGAGFTVLTARDGQEALEALKRDGLPSIITLDIEMPRMDGLETLFAIRQMPGAGDLPIFMMTSRGGTKHRRAAEQLGATQYFTKPYRDAELANAARAACALGA